MEPRKSGFIEVHANKGSPTAPIKIHVSLDPEVYLNNPIVVRALIDCLKSADKNTISGFKFTNDPRLYQSEIEEYEKALSTEDPKTSKIQLEFLIAERQRLLDGDQFTIYLPENINEKKLLALLFKIEEILASTKPGRFAATEVQVSSHLSIRKEVFDAIDRGQIKNPILRTLRENHLALEINNKQIYVSAVLPEDIGNEEYNHKKTVEFLIAETSNLPIVTYLQKELRKPRDDFMNAADKMLMIIKAFEASGLTHFADSKFEKVQKQIVQLVQKGLKSGLPPTHIREVLAEKGFDKRLEIPDKKGKFKYRDEVEKLLGQVSPNLAKTPS